jgi:hypothetical protein
VWWLAGASMKHQIIRTDLRTDLLVTTIALGTVVACAVVGFMFTFVTAPF